MNLNAEHRVPQARSSHSPSEGSAARPYGFCQLPSHRRPPSFFIAHIEFQTCNAKISIATFACLGLRSHSNFCQVRETIDDDARKEFSKVVSLASKRGTY
ncbi:hypothetical protein BOTBODRAFT_31864 [Botryobasidium botryosum FD-172 SS1]|uniref:Uncharacterized protein n=1 Tax=Botryobasidium botryosum (strain FD-172 SS1) TaxID=930990 RepID=A0A067MTK6_BOTB1|nr:hypothetical protein BOTBODRAFT_31864 [Botryobasidium botryosum FD-172 SS1]